MADFSRYVITVMIKCVGGSIINNPSIAGLGVVRGASGYVAYKFWVIPLSDQKRLFEFIPTEEIGVRMNASQLIIPQKSISMIIGIGHDMPLWTLSEVCTRCSLKNTCSHRLSLRRNNYNEPENK